MSQLEDRTTEITQYRQHREKVDLKNKQSFQGPVGI